MKNVSFLAESRTYHYSFYIYIYIYILYSHNHYDINNNSTYTYANTKHNRRTQMYKRLRCSGTNSLLTSWLQFFDTRRETIHKSLSCYTMLTTPQRSVYLVVQSQFPNAMIGPQLLHNMVGTQLFNSIVGPNFSQSLSDPNFNCLPLRQTTQLLDSMAENSILYTLMAETQLSASSAHSQLPTDSFSKSSNSQDHRFWGWHHSHSSFISYQGFIMTFVIFISSARERELCPMSVRLN